MKEIIDTIWTASASAITTGVNDFMWQVLIGTVIWTIIGFIVIAIFTWWTFKN